MIVLFIIIFLELINLKDDVIQSNFSKDKKIYDFISLNYSEKDRLPLRLLFNHTKHSRYYCYQVGQLITFPNNQYQLRCSQKDILNQNQLKNLNFTLNYIQDLIFKYIKINRNNDLIEIEQKNYSIDLFIQLYTVPFPEEMKSIGGTSSIVELFNDFRPKKTKIILPSSQIPFSMDYNFIRRDRFFLIIFHELVHCLGFNTFMFEKFLNRETGFPWGNSFPITKYINPKFPYKVFTLLQTPMAHKYSSKRFGISEFAPGIPMGIEMEQSGGNGTAGHHPEFRIYSNEVFVGYITNHPTYISDLVLSLIEDMGWYSVDFDLAEHLPWGNNESLGIKSLNKFPNSPPLDVFPEHYYVKDRNKEIGCSYDFQSIAKLSIINNSCPYDDNNYCNSSLFYNSKSLNYRGFEKTDYLPIYSSLYDSYCQDSKNSFNIKNSFINLMNFSNNSFCWNLELINKTKTSGCYESYCDQSNNFIEFIFNQHKFKCNFEGELINVNHSNVNIFICPSPLVFCNTIKLKEKKIFNFLRIPFPNDIIIDSTTYLNINYNYIYIILILMIILFFIYFYKFQKIKEESTFKQFI